MFQIKDIMLIIIESLIGTVPQLFKRTRKQSKKCSSPHIMQVLQPNLTGILKAN